MLLRDSRVSTSQLYIGAQGLDTSQHLASRGCWDLSTRPHDCIASFYPRNHLPSPKFLFFKISSKTWTNVWSTFSYLWRALPFLSVYLGRATESLQTQETSESNVFFNLFRDPGGLGVLCTSVLHRVTQSLARGFLLGACHS